MNQYYNEGPALKSRQEALELSFDPFLGVGTWKLDDTRPKLIYARVLSSLLLEMRLEHETD